MKPIKLDDPNWVLWLQQALMRVVIGNVYIDANGQFDYKTRKALTAYQRQNKLPPTGEITADIVDRIEKELAVLDKLPNKKKQQIS